MMSERLNQNFYCECTGELPKLIVLALHHCYLPHIHHSKSFDNRAGSNGLFPLLSAEMVLVGVATTHVLFDHVGLLLTGKSMESGFGDVKLIGSLLFKIGRASCRERV